MNGDASMSIDDYPHLIQYTDPTSGHHRSTVLCVIHEADLLGNLHQLRVGCVGYNANPAARCDRCKDRS